MATDLTRRKLREASFFLGEMSKREGSSRLDTEEEFGYYLSAFLSAARSVSFVLRKENPLTYEAHRDESATAGQALKEDGIWKMIAYVRSYYKGDPSKVLW